jgi:hypothetical protein
MSGKRIRRKDLRQPDEFMEVTGRVWQWLVANQRNVYAAAIAVAVLVAGLAGMRSYQNSRLQAASNAFRRATTLLADGNDAAAIEALDEVAPVANYGALAGLYRGYAALDTDDAPGAVTAFEEVAGQVRLPVYLRQEALYNLAFAQSQAGNADDALSSYVAAGELPGPFRVDALLNAGELSRAAGREDAAREFYERAVNDAQADGSTQDDLRRVAERRLVALGVGTP